MKGNQLTSSRSVGMRDINAFAPISRIKTLRDDEGLRGTLKCHAESSLLSISTAEKRQGRAPEQNPFGMITHFKDAALNKNTFKAPLYSGFTLIELLVVVLIIGVLAAIALPQYQKAVLKSRYGSMMMTAKAVSEGNEMYYLAQGQYAGNVADLDVKVSNAAGDMRVNIVGNTNEDYAYTIASRPDINNNYIIYQKQSKNYPGEIHCEAVTDNTLAQWVCETAFHGTKITDDTLTSGYTLYVLEGSGVRSTPAADSLCASYLSEGVYCESSCSGDTCTKLVAEGAGNPVIITCNMQGKGCKETSRQTIFASYACMTYAQDGLTCTEWQATSGGHGDDIFDIPFAPDQPEQPEEPDLDLDW